MRLRDVRECSPKAVLRRREVGADRVAKMLQRTRPVGRAERRMKKEDRSRTGEQREIVITARGDGERCATTIARLRTMRMDSLLLLLFSFFGSLPHADEAESG